MTGRETKSDYRCPNCGEVMGEGYSEGDECFECWDDEAAESATFRQQTAL